MIHMLAAVCVVLLPWCSSAWLMPSVRPPPPKRLFNSTAVEATIANFTARMVDPNLAILFQNCFPNTLDTTVVKASEGDSFIITGDIDAMWLRDSATQVMPYLHLLSSGDGALQTMLHGLALRQLRSVCIDPYANAFNEAANGNGHQTDLRDPPMQPMLFEGKYELDSLCSTIRLVYHATVQSNNFSIINTALFQRAATLIVEVMENQTSSTTDQDMTFPYRFFRDDYPFEYDAYPQANPVGYTGMVRTAFRPSDDLATYDFLTPSNAMAYVELGHLEELLNLTTIVDTQPLVKRVRALRRSILRGLNAYARNASTGTFVFEQDGFNHTNMMDEANIPNLLSLSFLGFTDMPKEVAATREWSLSSSNPWYFCGLLGCGVGSPHTGRDFIWPVSLIMRALTSSNDTEILTQLEMLKESARYTGLMHESFSMNDVKNFTRPWFALANSMFGELILSLAHYKPHLIFGS